MYENVFPTFLDSKVSEYDDTINYFYYLEFFVFRLFLKFHVYSLEWSEVVLVFKGNMSWVHSEYTIQEQEDEERQQSFTVFHIERKKDTFKG